VPVLVHTAHLLFPLQAECLVIIDRRFVVFKHLLIFCMFEAVKS